MDATYSLQEKLQMLWENRHRGYCKHCHEGNSNKHQCDESETGKLPAEIQYTSWLSSSTGGEEHSEYSWSVPQDWSVFWTNQRHIQQSIPIRHSSISSDTKDDKEMNSADFSGKPLTTEHAYRLFGN